MSTDELLCRLDAFTTAASLSSVHIHGFWAPYSLTLPSSWTRITSLSVEYSDRWDEEAALEEKQAASVRCRSTATSDLEQRERSMADFFSEQQMKSREEETARQEKAQRGPPYEEE